MGCSITILGSENELRAYVLSNAQNICQIIVFEDILDKTIFFYCFKTDNSIVATKEFFYKNFSFYKRCYKKLAKQINFSVSDYKKHQHAIRLVSKPEKKRYT